MFKWIENLLALQNADLKTQNYETRLTVLPKEMLLLKEERDKTIASVNQAADDARKFERLPRLPNPKSPPCRRKAKNWNSNPPWSRKILNIRPCSQQSH